MEVIHALDYGSYVQRDTKLDLVADVVVVLQSPVNASAWSPGAMSGGGGGSTHSSPGGAATAAAAAGIGGMALGTPGPGSGNGQPNQIFFPNSPVSVVAAAATTAPSSQYSQPFHAMQIPAGAVSSIRK